MSSYVRHFACAYWVLGSDHDCLVLTVSCDSRTSPLANWVSILLIRAIRSAIDRLVPPISSVQSTLWASVIGEGPILLTAIRNWIANRMILVMHLLA